MRRLLFGNKHAPQPAGAKPKQRTGVKPVKRSRRRIAALVLANVAIYSVAGYVILYTVRDLAKVDLPVPLPPRVSSIVAGIQGNDGPPGLDDLPGPGEYVPADAAGNPAGASQAPPPLPPVVPVPPTIDPASSADLRRVLESVGLYVAAGIEGNASEVRAVGVREVPKRLESLNMNKPDDPVGITMRISRVDGELQACLKGEAPRSGTWYYLFPPGELTTSRDAKRCP